MEIIISPHPEYAAIAWGSIRLVLQLASNYVSFFNNFTQSLARLARQFPQAQLIDRIYRGQYSREFSEHVRDALCQVCVNIFDFLQSVARVFTKKDGKYKHRPLIAFGLAWKPFNSRFDDTLQRLNRSTDTLRDVVYLDQIEASIKAREETANERKAAGSERLAAAERRKEREVANAISELERNVLLEKFDKEAKSEIEKEDHAEENLEQQKGEKH